MTIKTKVSSNSNNNDATANRLPLFWEELFKSPIGIIGALILIFMIILGVLAPVIAPYDPDQFNLRSRLSPPSTTSMSEGQPPHYFGTDSIGRDLLSRVLYGARLSILIGLIASLLGGLVGVSLGMIAGYYEGRLDSLISWLINVQLAFPFTLLAIFIIAVFGGGLTIILIVLAWSTWVNYARIMRGQVLSVKRRQYVEAGYSMGAKPIQVMFRHILPNAISPLIVVMTFTMASAILVESSLSFLGLGVDPSIPTWGSILNDGRNYLQDAWWIATFPGLALLITVLGANLFGDWLRDYLDPQLRI